MELLKRFLAAIAGSKKAIAAIATVIFVLLAPQLARIGLEVTKEEISYAVQIAMAYLVGQGVADFGKGRVLAEAAIAAKNTKPPGTASGEIG